MDRKQQIRMAIAATNAELSNATGFRASRSYRAGRFAENLLQRAIADGTCWLGDPRYIRRWICHANNQDGDGRGQRFHFPGGRSLVAPDFEFETVRGTRFFLDVKGKLYHSLYERDRTLEQFVDKRFIEDYHELAQRMHCRTLVLIHLIPDEVALALGATPERRVQGWQGNYREPPRNAPTHDRYYLGTTEDWLGSRRGMCDREEGYYCKVSRLAMGGNEGELPAIAAWADAVRGAAPARATMRETRYLNYAC